MSVVLIVQKLNRGKEVYTEVAKNVHILSKRMAIVHRVVVPPLAVIPGSAKGYRNETGAASVYKGCDEQRNYSLPWINPLYPSLCIDTLEAKLAHPSVYRYEHIKPLS